MLWSWNEIQGPEHYDSALLLGHECFNLCLPICKLSLSGSIGVSCMELYGLVLIMFEAFVV